MECAYHPELDRRLRECEELKRITMENHEQIKSLFGYHDDHGEILTDIRINQTTIQERQKQSIAMLSEIKESFEVHLKIFDVLAEDIKKFSWFRDSLNTLKDKLPWWLVYAICVIIAILTINHKEIWERFAQLTNGVQK